MYLGFSDEATFHLNKSETKGMCHSDTARILTPVWKTQHDSLKANIFCALSKIKATWPILYRKHHFWYDVSECAETVAMAAAEGRLF
jgi:hypothetical protein